MEENRRPRLRRDRVFQERNDLFANRDDWLLDRFRLPRPVLLDLCDALGPALQPQPSPTRPTSSSDHPWISGNRNIPEGTGRPVWDLPTYPLPDNASRVGWINCLDAPIYPIPIQAICDADYLMTNVVARWPWSTHDTFILRNSSVGRRLEAGAARDGWLLGMLSIIIIVLDWV